MLEENNLDTTNQIMIATICIANIILTFISLHCIAFVTVRAKKNNNTHQTLILFENSFCFTYLYIIHFIIFYI